jgi:hypothetical protein
MIHINRDKVLGNIQAKTKKYRKKIEDGGFADEVNTLLSIVVMEIDNGIH